MEAGKKIELVGAQNTRDLGGYRTRDGRRIKYRKLIRSGELSRAAASDLRTLYEDYDLRTIIDFRTLLERREKPDQYYPNVDNISNPILSEEVMGISAGNGECRENPMDSFIRHAASLNGNPRPYIAKLYRDLVSDPFSVEHYGRFFELLLEKGEDGAVLWHCSAGKDRVGVGTAFLLTALGVDRQTVIEDYVKSNGCMKKEIEALVRLVYEKTHDEMTAGSARILDGVEPEYIETAFSYTEEAYGSVETYLLSALKLDEGKIKRLRDMYLE